MAMGIWTPEAVWVGPSPNQSGAMKEQRGMVLHVMQGSLAGSIAWGKNPDSNVSFHFGTRKSDGRVEQLVDTDITAWTQCNGNGYWVSVENEDYSGNPLSAAQIESVAKLYARGVRTYNWPLQITDSPNVKGLGWHGMGGTAWCNHPTCPGQPIKDQRQQILTRAQQILLGIGGDDMAQMLVSFSDATDPSQVWLVDGQRRRKVKPAWLGNAPAGQPVNGPIGNGQSHQAGLLGPLSNGGKVFVSGGDPDVWGVEEVAASGGGGGLTEAEVAAVVRAELDQTKLTKTP